MLEGHDSGAASAGDGGGSKSGACPPFDMGAVGKALSSLLAPFAVAVVLALLCTLHRMVPHLTCWPGYRVFLPKFQPGMYAAAATQLTLLAYAVLATAAAALSRCIGIGGRSVLYIDGNVQCWQPWQVVSAAFFFGSSLLAPAALVVVGGRVRAGRASAPALWAAIVFPLPFLVGAAWRWSTRRGYCSVRPASPAGIGVALLGDGQGDAGGPAPVRGWLRGSAEEAVALTLTGPYQSSMWWWDAALLARRLLLIAVAVFVPDPLTRSLLAALCCMVALASHVAARPFASARVNALETCFVSLLVVLALLNVRTGSLAALALQPSGAVAAVQASAVQTLEAVALGTVPALVCVFGASEAVQLVLRAMAARRSA